MVEGGGRGRRNVSYEGAVASVPVRGSIGLRWRCKYYHEDLRYVLLRFVRSNE